MTLLGRTLAPVELAGRNLLALFGRAEARDFPDVYVLIQRLGKEVLLGEARAADAGSDERVLAQMMSTLDRFADDEIRIQASPHEPLLLRSSHFLARVPISWRGVGVRPVSALSHE